MLLPRRMLRMRRPLLPRRQCLFSIVLHHIRFPIHQHSLLIIDGVAFRVGPGWKWIDYLLAAEEFLIAHCFYTTLLFIL